MAYFWPIRQGGSRRRLTEERRIARQEQSTSIVEKLKPWLEQQLRTVSAKSPIAEAIQYGLNHWDGLVLFLDDGRIELDTNNVENAIRPIALGRRSWLFAGSDRGGERAAMMYTLICSAKMNDIDPQAWLADVLARIADCRNVELEALLPWNWKPQPNPAAQAA